MNTRIQGDASEKIIIEIIDTKKIHLYIPFFMTELHLQNEIHLATPKKGNIFTYTQDLFTYLNAKISNPKSSEAKSEDAARFNNLRIYTE